MKSNLAKECDQQIPTGQETTGIGHANLQKNHFID